MRIILFISTAFFIISCSSTKKQLQSDFRVAYGNDTGYYTIKLSLYTAKYFSWKENYMQLLVARGYIRQVGTRKQQPVYEVTEKGKPYLITTYYNPASDSEHIALLNYYRAKVKLDKYSFTNATKDTLEAVFQLEYEVMPMFNLRGDESKQVEMTFYKTKEGHWKVNTYSLFGLYSEIYRARDPVVMSVSANVNDVE